MKPLATPAQPRNSGLAQIHIAKAQLRMSDDDYRAMLWGVARVRSAADLDHAGRAKVLEHLKRCGWSPARGSKPYPGRPRAIEGTDRSAQLRKVEALLADAGRPWDYAHAMCKRMFGVDRVDFATPLHLQKLIAALMYDQRRREQRSAS
jgi:phage gp16-like protein